MDEWMNGASSRCCPEGLLTKIANRLYGGESTPNNPIIQSIHYDSLWSQSRVLPSAELAYETCLGAGSIAVGHQKWSPTNKLQTARSKLQGTFKFQTPKSKPYEPNIRT